MSEGMARLRAIERRILRRRNRWARFWWHLLGWLFVLVAAAGRVGARQPLAHHADGYLVGH